MSKTKKKQTLQISITERSRIAVDWFKAEAARLGINQDVFFAAIIAQYRATGTKENFVLP